MKRFDCHCHVFNIVNVGVRAIYEQLHSSSELFYSNLDQNDFRGKLVLEQKDKLGLLGRIKKIAELIRIFKNDDEKIFGMLDKHYHHQYVLLPLMFDGDFLLESYNDKDLSYMREVVENACVSTDEETYSRLEAFSDEQHKDCSLDNDSQVIFDFIDEISEQASHSRNLRSIKSSGFQKQYEQIQLIVKDPKYKNRILPFLGVDPRRSNIKSYLNQVGKGKLFAGIKVYPPNGFSPMDKVLVGNDSIFEYCTNNRIPVVSHCSYGGFATPAMDIFVNGVIIPESKSELQSINGEYKFNIGLRDGFTQMVCERARVLNSPLIWEKVLEMYPNLILVLAHFGSGNTQWQADILRMMKIYPNLYTDVSCMSDSAIIANVKKVYIDNPDIQHKILYGSDYFLDMFFNDSFDQYLNRMKEIFGSEIFDKISSENPIKYISKWYD